MRDGAALYYGGRFAEKACKRRTLNAEERIALKILVERRVSFLCGKKKTGFVFYGEKIVIFLERLYNEPNSKAGIKFQNLEFFGVHYHRYCVADYRLFDAFFFLEKLT